MKRILPVHFLCLLLFQQAGAQIRLAPRRSTTVPTGEVRTTTTVKPANTYTVALQPGSFMENTPIIPAPANPGTNSARYYPAAIEIVSDDPGTVYYTMDCLGDGSVEILSVGNQQKNILVLSDPTASGFSRSASYALPQELMSHYQLLFGNFSHDFGNHLMVYYPSIYTFSAYNRNSTAVYEYQDPKKILVDWVYTHNMYAGDFNGDGKSDMLAWDHGKNQWHVAVYQPDPYSKLGQGTMKPAGVWLQNWAQTQDMTCVVGDYNGDKKDDIALVHKPTGEWWVALSTGSGFQPATGYKNGIWLKPWAIGAHQQVFAVDVNNDGRTDLLNYDSRERSFQAVLSNGQYFDYFFKKEYLDKGISNPVQVIAGRHSGNAMIGIVHVLPPDQYYVNPRKVISLYYTSYRR